MADYLFWHRANTENSGFFRENRYLDPAKVSERERERKVRDTVSTTQSVFVAQYQL